MLPEDDKVTVNRGREMAQISLRYLNLSSPVPYRQMSVETQEGFAITQQVTYNLPYSI